MQAHAPHTPEPLSRELLLIGGGHSHVAVVRAFGMRPVAGVGVTLVSRDVHTPYSGMLPGLVAGHYGFDDCHIDLRPLCEANGVRLIHAEVEAMHPASRTVRIAGRGTLRYDWASINIGSRPALGGIAGAATHGIGVKPIDRFLAHWLGLLEDLRAHPRPCRLLVVGGGAAGVEIALSCAWRAREALGANAALFTVGIVNAAPVLLPSHNALVRRYFVRELARRGIELHSRARVASADAQGVTLADGRRLEADQLVWATQAGAAAWPAAAGLACDAGGFIRVDDCLQSVSHPDVFAAGDIAALSDPCPKSGVYAVREGQALASSLRRVVQSEAPVRYRAQRRFLSLVSTGDRRAVVSRGALFAAGRWAWRWKDRIDRAFMAMYRAEPVAPPAPGAAPAMRCGGCAAKIGGDALGRVLGDLARPPREGVEAGMEIGDDAAVLVPPPGQRLVQSVDYFRGFVDDPFLVGQVSAVHALGDLLAMGARPHSALAIATVPFAAPRVMEQTLALLMQGALKTLDAEGVALIGGHSSEGAELAFGLSVNGYAAPGEILYKGGLRDGHALVLTKGIGTGTLLAANGAAAAQGRWIDAALTGMTQSSRAAAGILRQHGATACTDITGFGLLGHLLEMLRASGTGARLRMDAVPVLDGARECLARGYRSSLHERNRADVAALVEPVTGAMARATEILLDPQTAGGLLAGIPAGHAASCVAALRAAGYPAAAVIGSCSSSVGPGGVVIY
jgi:selenide,water dikinase